MTVESDIKTRARARWLRHRLEGKVPSEILAAMTNEELIEQYEVEQRGNRQAEGEARASGEKIDCIALEPCLSSSISTAF